VRGNVFPEKLVGAGHAECLRTPFAALELAAQCLQVFGLLLRGEHQVTA
jgi:hypothetical protein